MIIKKRVGHRRILYKVKWSNGSISYEPLRTMEAEMLQIVEQWEIREHYK